MSYDERALYRLEETVYELELKVWNLEDGLGALKLENKTLEAQLETTGQRSTTEDLNLLEAINHTRAEYREAFRLIHDDLTTLFSGYELLVNLLNEIIEVCQKFENLVYDKFAALRNMCSF